jgi:hypothetical protein
MAVLSKEDYMGRIKGIVGEDTSDESLAMIEDFSDTYDDLVSKATPPEGDGEDWKQKYEELDATWRKKYTDRFFDGGSGDDDPPKPKEDEGEEEKELTYENLFEEEKE